MPLSPSEKKSVLADLCAHLNMRAKTQGEIAGITKTHILAAINDMDSDTDQAIQDLRQATTQPLTNAHKNKLISLLVEREVG